MKGTPLEIAFAPGGGLDRAVHGQPVTLEIDFEDGVMDIFAAKKNLRVIRIGNIDRLQNFVGQRCVEFKSLIDGGLIAQWSFVPKSRGADDLTLASDFAAPTRDEHPGTVPADRRAHRFVSGVERSTTWTRSQRSPGPW